MMIQGQGPDSQFKPFARLRRTDSSSNYSSSTASTDALSPTRCITPKPEKEGDSFHRRQPLPKKELDDSRLVALAEAAMQNATSKELPAEPGGFGFQATLPSFPSRRRFDLSEMEDDEDEAPAPLPFVDETDKTAVMEQQKWASELLKPMASLNTALISTAASTGSFLPQSQSASSPKKTSVPLKAPPSPRLGQTSLRDLINQSNTAPYSYLSDSDSEEEAVYMPPTLGIDTSKPLTGPLATQERLLEILKIPYPIKMITPQGAYPAQSAEDAAKTLKTAKKVALGDLHGSYHKLVETLVAADMIRMPEEAAIRFVQLASHPWNYSPDPKQLDQIYSKLQPVVDSMEWTGKDRQFTLIGDVLSDRGPFDQITMHMVHDLAQKHRGRIVPIVGNHEHNVLRTGKPGYFPIVEESANSLIAAQRLAAEMNDWKGLYERYADYLTKSKVMHYDRESKTLYVHAPIHRENAEQLIAWLQKQEALKMQRETPGKDAGASAEGKTTDHDGPARIIKNYDEIKTEEDLEGLIEVANQKYGEYVRDVLETGQLDPELEKVLVDTKGGGQGFFWRRSRLDSEADLPFKQCGVKRLVHGHDLRSQDSPFSIEKDPAGAYTLVNLDQEARKSEHMELLFPAKFHRQYPHSKDESRLYIEQ